MTIPFIGQVDINEYLRIDADDDLGIIAADSACEIVRGYTGQTFNRVVDDEVVLDGTGTGILYLPERPVIDVTSVAWRAADLTAGSEETLTAEVDYVLGDSALYLLNKAYWIEGRQNVFVTYSHGYDEIPSDVRMVALQIAARIYDVGMVTNENTGTYSASYVEGAAGLTPFEKGVLYRYRSVALV